MKTIMTMTIVAVAAMALAVPVDAASACAALVCEQVTTNTHAPTQTNAQTQVCAGNIQVGVAGGDQKQCEQTAYQCNVNGEDVETDTFQKRARSDGCNGSTDAFTAQGVLITFA